MSCPSTHILALLLLALVAPFSNFAQTPKRVVRIFLDLKETNLDKKSTVGTNTLTERLAAAGFRVTSNRKEAVVVLEGTLSSRKTPVTDEVHREGGVNAEAAASIRLLVGTEIIATSVERTMPADWGVQAERLGEDRLIEVAGLVADDLFANDILPEVMGGESKTPPPAKPPARPAGPGKPAKQAKETKKPRKGVSFLEVCNLVQNSAPEERIIAALKKYGIKFKPKDEALIQLRGLGATEALITAVKSCPVVV